jgi:copper transport protein
MARLGSPLLLVALTVAALLLAIGAPAGAHALRQSSFPDAGATLAKAPGEVRVTFGEEPDPRLSSLRVLDTGGHDHTAGPTTAVPGQPLALRVPVGPLPNGVYTVAWRTVSRVDGHLAAGTFAFGVGVTPTGAAAAGPGAARAPGPSTANLASRWLLYLGLMLVVGGSAATLLCFDALRARLLALLGLGVLAGAVGAVGISADQLHSAGLPLSRLFDSPFAHQLLSRLVPLAIAVVPVAAAAAIRRPPLRRMAVAAAGVLGVAGMWGDVESSHVAAAHALRWGRMAVQLAHFGAAAVWVGGLAALLLGLQGLSPEARARVARRFSSVALAMVAVIAATGVQRAFDEVGTLHRLYATTFGRWVLLKVALLSALIVLGALNRYRSVPAVARTPRPLRAVARTELGLVAVVLVATGFIQGLAPPASGAGARVVHPLVLTGSDFATTVRVRLSVTPATAGFNQFLVTVADYDSGRPVDDANVSLRFALPARPDLGESTLTLSRTEPGTHAGQGANVSIDGSWSVTVLIQRSTGGTEVPLSLTTRQPPERIDVQRSAGTPDLYTLHLRDGRAVQSYLDPGQAGTHVNEFHVTVIQPDGNELAMTDVTVAATGPGQRVASTLAVRRLDPAGHFVADLLDAAGGAYRFDVTGTTQTGEQLQGHFTIPVR